MISISLCMIVKNEEKTLEHCLQSMHGIVDEIIIVDTGSSDKTKDIAYKFTDKVFDFEWVDDFSKARNYSYEKATKDYILWLDADDILKEDDRAKFLALKMSLDSSVDAVMMKYNTGFDNKGNVTFSYYRERLCKRSADLKWIEPVHEYLVVPGIRINSEVCVTHTKHKSGKSGRNLQIYESRLKNGEQLSARGKYYYARELNDNGRYHDAIEAFECFLDTGLGWVEDNIAACSELARCYQMENNREDALRSLLRSFTYDTPRAEICCQIAYVFKNENDYNKALFWFELALNLKKPENSWGFIQHDSWGYIPCIECVVCYDRLGMHDKAEEFNEKAGMYKPGDPSVLYNKKYLQEKRAKTG